MTSEMETSSERRALFLQEVERITRSVSDYLDSTSAADPIEYLLEARDVLGAVVSFLRNQDQT